MIINAQNYKRKSNRTANITANPTTKLAAQSGLIDVPTNDKARSRLSRRQWGNKIHETQASSSTTGRPTHFPVTYNNNDARQTRPLTMPRWNTASNPSQVPLPWTTQRYFHPWVFFSLSCWSFSLPPPTSPCACDCERSPKQTVSFVVYTHTRLCGRIR